MEQKKTDSDKDGNKDGGRGRDDVAKTDDSGMDLDIPENTDTNRNKDKSNNSNKNVNRTPGRHDRTANRGSTSRYVQRRVDPLHSFVISSLLFVMHFSSFSLCFPLPLFILHSLFLCHHSFFFSFSFTHCSFVLVVQNPLLLFTPLRSTQQSFLRIQLEPFVLLFPSILIFVPIQKRRR